MKKIILFLIVVFTCISCNQNVRYADYTYNELYQVGNGFNKIYMRYFDFNGHRYIRMSGSGYTGFTHDPDCPYCKNKNGED